MSVVRLVVQTTICVNFLVLFSMCVQKHVGDQSCWQEYFWGDSPAASLQRKKREEKIPVFLNKRRILATNNGLQYTVVPMDSVLTQNSNRKIGVTQIYFILRPLGSSDYHSSFQLVIQTFQWLHNDFSVTFPWLLRDFSVTFPWLYRLQFFSLPNTSLSQCGSFEGKQIHKRLQEAKAGVQ